jgi:hypothetical protein
MLYRYSILFYTTIILQKGPPRRHWSITENEFAWLAYTRLGSELERRRGVWRAPVLEVVAGIGPVRPSGDSGFVCGPFGYQGSAIPNASRWTPQSHLEAYATVFAGSAHRLIAAAFVRS